MVKSVTVFCASSTKADKVYQQSAFDLGCILANAQIKCYYGGGRVGLMGELAKAMVERHAEIEGIIPQFMVDEGWDNPDVHEIVVDDMQSRKKMLITFPDAIVALPGGCGTLEELMEAITSRQLGIITAPIVIVNINEYFTPLINMLNNAISANFMRLEHKQLWVEVNKVEDVLSAINAAPKLENARGIAAM